MKAEWKSKSKNGKWANHSSVSFFLWGVQNKNNLLFEANFDTFVSASEIVDRAGDWLCVQERGNTKRRQNGLRLAISLIKPTKLCGTAIGE